MAKKQKQNKARNPEALAMLDRSGPYKPKVVPDRNKYKRKPKHKGRDI